MRAAAVIAAALIGIWFVGCWDVSHSLSRLRGQAPRQKASKYEASNDPERPGRGGAGNGSWGVDQVSVDDIKPNGYSQREADPAALDAGHHPR